MAVALSPQSYTPRFPHEHLHNFINLKPRLAMDQPAETRPSLPSISSLIEAVKDHAEAGYSPEHEHSRVPSTGSPRPTTTPERPSSSGSPRIYAQLSPELRPTSSFAFSKPSRGSASPTTPVVNGVNHTSYAPSPSNTSPESYAQKHSSYPPIPDMNHWPPSQPVRHSPEAAVHESNSTPRTSSYPDPVLSNTAHRQSPSIYPDPVDSPEYSALAQQRPLPSNFPPHIPAAGQTLPPIDPQMAPQWQHHHYYPPVGASTYTQTQERYVCPTCNKPFSRPSSLKIHTYSHTGEKPYKCKHEGCGKYFSVRSNMKRHEKGCHGGDSNSSGGKSPQVGA